METTSKAQQRTSSMYKTKCAFCDDRRSDSCSRRFHRFPNDPHMSEKWAVASRKKWILSASVRERNQRYRVCSLHFSDADYSSNMKNRLHIDAVPEPWSDLKIAEAKQRWISIKSQLTQALHKQQKEGDESDVRRWKYDEQLQVLMPSKENNSKQLSSFAGDDSEEGKQGEQEEHQLIAEIFTEYDVSLPTDSPTPSVSKLFPMNAIPIVYQSIQCNSSSTVNSASKPRLLSQAIKTSKQSDQCNKNKYDTSSAADAPTSNSSKSISPPTETMNTLPGECQSIEYDNSAKAKSCVVISLPAMNAIPGICQSIQYNSSSTANFACIPRLSLPKAFKTLKQSYQCNKNKYDTSSAADFLTSNQSKPILPPTETMGTLPGECQSLKYDNSPKANSSRIVISSVPAMKTLKGPYRYNECSTSTSAEPVPSDSPNVSRLSPTEEMNTMPEKYQPIEDDTSSVTHSPSLSSVSLPEKIKTLRNSYQHNISSTANSATSNSPFVLRLSLAETKTTKSEERQPTEHNSSADSANVQRLLLPELNDNDGTSGESTVGLETVKTLREPSRCNAYDTSSIANSVASNYPDVLKLSHTKATNTILLESHSMEYDSSSTSDSPSAPRLPSPELDDNLGESAVESEAMKTLRETHQCNQHNTSSAADSTVSNSPSTSSLTSLEIKKRKTEAETLTVKKCLLQHSEKELDSIDMFFLTVASSVKKFSSHDQYIVKSQISDLVNKMEEKYMASKIND